LGNKGSGGIDFFCQSVPGTNFLYKISLSLNSRRAAEYSFRKGTLIKIIYYVEKQQQLKKVLENALYKS